MCCQVSTKNNNNETDLIHGGCVFLIITVLFPLFIVLTKLLKKPHFKAGTDTIRSINFNLN